MNIKNTRVNTSSQKCKQCGVCCNNIWLPLSPIELQKRYVIWLTGVGDRNAEIHLIYPMLKWKGEGGEFSITSDTGTVLKIKKWLYKCAHVQELEEETAEGFKTICTIHAHRPDMCRQYPFYGDKVIPETVTVYPECVYYNKNRKHLSYSLVGGT